MRSKRFKAEDFKNLKDYFGIITFITFALGYIGFYAYSSKYSLPFVYPDISLVASIGIITLLFIGGCYLVSGGKMRRSSIAVQTLLLYFAIIILVGQLNPIFLFIFLYTYIDRNVEDFIWISKKGDFGKRRKKLKNLRKKNLIWERIISLIFLLIGIFFNLSAAISWLFIHSCVLVLARMRYKIIEFHKIFLVAFLSPIFIFGFLLNNSNFSFFGLSRTPVILVKKDSTLIRGQLIFKDEDSYYLQDTTIGRSRNFFTTINGSIAISKNEILSFKVDTTKYESERPISMINIFKSDN